MSYYGLCLALERNEIGEGVRFCREAATLEGFNPDIRCNLGRVLMRAGLRREAYNNFARGLRLQPNHHGICRALRAMGLRRRPVLPFLSRQNRINVLLIRNSMSFISATVRAILEESSPRAVTYAAGGQMTPPGQGPAWTDRCA